MSSRYSDQYRHYTTVGDVLEYDPNGLIAFQNTHRAIYELFGIPPPSSSPPGAIISTYSMAQPPRTARSYDSAVCDGSAGANMMIRHDHGWQPYSCYPEPYSAEGDVVTPEKKKNRFGNWLRKNIVWNQNKK